MSRVTDFLPQLFVRELNDYRPATSDETLRAARLALSQRFRRGRSLNSPSLVRDYLRLAFGGLEHEVFGLVLLDSRHRLLSMLKLFRGTIDGASVHPREVVKEVLKHNAAAVILVHNHPSGCSEPSQADELITQRLKDALALIEIRVLDHFIVAGDQITSFAERGLL